MWISRVRVDGGYLAGLDIKFERGLNVIVGPRGAGKTTLLELLRHALGIEHADTAVAKRQREAVRNLLGAGEVIVELTDEQRSLHLVVDANGGGRLSDVETVALALGQNELEQIASNAQSRLNLIDLRARIGATAPSLSEAAVLTEQISALRLENERSDESMARRKLLEEEQALLVAEEAQLMSAADTELAMKREALRVLETDFLAIGTQINAATETLRGAVSVGDLFAATRTAIERIEPADTSLQVSATIKPILGRMIRRADEQAQDLKELQASVASLTLQLNSRLDRLRIEIEPLRAELEAAEAGLGQVTSKLRNVNAQLKTLDAQAAEDEARSAEIKNLVVLRDSLFDALETWQEELLEARQNVARVVTQDLQSRVVVSVEHLGETGSFAETLNSLLQGSGIQYKSATERISQAVLPRQLVGYIESSDAKSFAASTGMAEDRAARILAHLSAPERLARVASITLDDRVDFRLRDGASDRSVEELSTGQKCAVTLPVVLTERERILILDQPEDHLDNAYLVKNIVTAIESRGQMGAQTIVATHNANIPVLGGAPLVVALDSDGIQGHVKEKGSFDDEAIVESITSLMEGGRDAFKRRADFYAEHDGSHA